MKFLRWGVPVCLAAAFLSAAEPVCTAMLARVGKPRFDAQKAVFVEFPIKDIIPLHEIYRKEVPKPPLPVEDLMGKIQTHGYDLKFAVSFMKIPGSTFIDGSGHHRVEAMKRLGQETIPAVLYQWDLLSEVTQDFYLSQFPDVIRPHLRKK